MLRHASSEGNELARIRDRHLGETFRQDGLQNHTLPLGPIESPCGHCFHSRNCPIDRYSVNRSGDERPYDQQCGRGNSKRSPPASFPLLATGSVSSSAGSVSLVKVSDSGARNSQPRARAPVICRVGAPEPIPPLPAKSTTVAHYASPPCLIGTNPKSRASRRVVAGSLATLSASVSILASGFQASPRLAMASTRVSQVQRRRRGVRDSPHRRPDQLSSSSAARPTTTNATSNPSADTATASATPRRPRFRCGGLTVGTPD